MSTNPPCISIAGAGARAEGRGRGAEEFQSRCCQRGRHWRQARPGAGFMHDFIVYQIPTIIPCGAGRQHRFSALSIRCATGGHWSGCVGWACCNQAPCSGTRRDSVWQPGTPQKRYMKAVAWLRVVLLTSQGAIQTLTCSFSSEVLYVTGASA